MARKLHAAGDNLRTYLAENINASVTEFDVDSGAIIPVTATAPVYIQIGLEVMNVLSKSTNTITVAARTGGAPHFDGDIVDVVDTFEYVEELQDEIRDTQDFVAEIIGGVSGDGILTGDGTYLKVLATGTPDMYVHVSVGLGLTNRRPVRLTAAVDVGPFTAPVSNPRIDIVQFDEWGDISIVAGAEAASPVKPDPSANCVELCQVYHRVGETSIKNTDDAANGYITDSRPPQYL